MSSRVARSLDVSALNKAIAKGPSCIIYNLEATKVIEL